jgi:ribosome-associated heat shock protein Hsp15
MPADHQRLDKFLINARFCRNRELAEALIATGALRINRLPTEKLHARVRVGDVLTIPLPRGVAVVRVLALPDRRGTAEAARALYEDIEG